MEKDCFNVACQIPEIMIRQNIIDDKLYAVYDLIQLLEVYHKSEPDMYAIIECLKGNPIDECKRKTGIQLIVEGKAKDLMKILEHRQE
jgi:hypothetical protein